MQRSKFPYTAKSSAIVIRHAVGIDERRAKFRQDLISESKTTGKVSRGRDLQNHVADHLGIPQRTNVEPHDHEVPQSQRYRRKSHAPRKNTASRDASPARSMSMAVPSDAGTDGQSLHTVSSNPSLRPVRASTLHAHVDQADLDDEEEDADEALPQDIQEVWFPGCHAVSFDA